MSEIGNDFLLLIQVSMTRIGKLGKTIDMHKFLQFCTIKRTISILHSRYFTTYFRILIS